MSSVRAKVTIGLATRATRREHGDPLLKIRKDDLTGEKIVLFLRGHLEHMQAVTPPQSVHALDLVGLRAPAITFWSAWEGDELVGCGALKQLDSSTGEVKSMRTAEPHRRKGIATAMLAHIEKEAMRRGYTSLKLETGAMSEFAAGRALYERSGFVRCGPFGEYTGDPNSVFMTKTLRS
jgi:putative acetyltransferase